MTATPDVQIKTDDRPMTIDDPAMRGRVVVVTGAGRGMGAVFVRQLTARGVDVVGVDLRAEMLTAVAEEVNAFAHDDANLGRVVAVSGDVTDPDTHRSSVDAALAEFGRLDGWVNSAGIWNRGLLAEITADGMRQMMDVNVTGVLLGCQAAAAHMAANGGGSIVNVSSLAAFTARVGGTAYHSSKAAVRHLTNMLALELGPDGIRVNGIAPGFVDTEMLQWMRDEPGAHERSLAGVPLGRIGSPHEMFGPVFFLLSDAARYVSGVTMPVDGARQWV